MASSHTKQRCAAKEAPALPHPPSAGKRHRQSLRRQARNRVRLSAARTSVRRTRELIAAGAQEEAQAALREATSILDRTARRGVLHANTAGRRKSRLMRQFNALQAPAEEAPPKRRTRTAAKPRASGAKTKATARKTTGRSTRAKKS